MKILEGLVLLLQSPSGIFALLTLIAISVVSFHNPTIGSAAFTAFVAIIPAILAIVEHRETLAQMAQQSTAVPSIIPTLLQEVKSILPTRGSL